MDAEVIRGSQILMSFCILRTYDEAEDALDMLEVSGIDPILGSVLILCRK